MYNSQHMRRTQTWLSDRTWDVREWLIEHTIRSYEYEYEYQQIYQQEYISGGGGVKAFLDVRPLCREYAWI